MSEYGSLPPELEPVANHILFQFEDEIDKSRRSTFKEKTDWGFEMQGSVEETTTLGRWAYIIGLGPDVDEGFSIGQKILIEKLMWTKTVDYNGLKFARTDDTQVIAVQETE